MTDNNNPFEQDKDDQPKPERYRSQEGFIDATIIRGATELQPLWDEVNGKNCFVCGGYVRWMCSPNHSPELAKDVDVYCKNQGAFDYLQNVMENKFSMEQRWSNDMSIGYKTPKESSHPLFALPQINIIRPVLEAKIVAQGSMEEIISNFDFTVVRCAVVSLSAKLALVDADFMHDEEKKILRLKNIHCPVSSTMRCMKYSRKNYFLPPFEALKLFLDWSDRNDEYRAKLIDFLEKAEGEDGLSKEEIEEMEEMMRID